ncbi:MAG: ABC transporter ATP-binding protein [Gemmatimonadota bacterium]
MILRASQVGVHYPGTSRPALHGVSCTLSEGQLLAVVGPNGSGKTTLLRALLGITPRIHGSVELLGSDIGQWNPRELAQVLGVVAQREEMTYPLTVEETVMLGRYARLGSWSAVRPEDRAAVANALERCDVAELAHRRTDTLSGGEWQRVRVARALAQAPRALLLDEPTAALDIRHEMEVFELIRQLVTEGLGAIVITHHLNLAARYATHMILLSRGEVAAEGPPAQVLRREILEQVFEWPVAVTHWLDTTPQLVPLRPGETSR